MALDVTDTVRGALGNVLREALKNANDVTPTKSKSGPLSGAKGIAAGVGLAAAAPLVAKKGLEAARSNGMGPSSLASKAASKAGDKVKEAVSSKVDEAGGAGGIAKQAAGGLIPGLGGGDDSKGGGKGGLPGVGKGRRMPIQQSVDVAVPLETAYNQWTQFEDWPTFMHRVTNVTQDDDDTVRFATKIWGKTKEFEAKIITQRPDERIKWRVAQGITHTGVVTFHELAPRLTRVELTMDVDPGSLIEKAARGMRHVKRAARADLHRFKAFIEVQEQETGAWRGVIEDGEVVEEHDDSYDEERDYSDIEEIKQEAEEEDQDSEDEDEDKDEDEGQSGNGNGGGRERTQRFKRQAEATRKSASSRSTGGGSSSKRRSGSSSGSGSGSRSKSSGSGSGSGSRSKSSSSGSRSKSASSSSGRSSKPKSSSTRRKSGSRS
jgi:uncharacterized membrane protein